MALASAIPESRGQGQQSLTLQFSDCRIDRRAALALQYMLKSLSRLVELSFQRCVFNAKSVEAIEYGMIYNQSLRKYECIFNDLAPKSTPVMNVLAALEHNANLVKLNLTVVDDKDNEFWTTFRGALDSKTLESLCFTETKIEIDTMESILLKCFVIKSLKELAFHKCRIEYSAMKLLVKALSDNQILDTLILDGIIDGSRRWN